MEALSARLPRYYGLIPGAGTGARMGAMLPKQYLDIAGQPMIAHAVRALLASERIERVFVVLASDDEWWAHYDWQFAADRLTLLRCGGDTRADSVSNGLVAMAAADDDWVLVHDAARPCLDGSTLEQLIDEVGEDAVGGLLAVPLADTLKRAGSGQRVAATVPREGLWQAQTPQMFRYGLLMRALSARADDAPTDEASAVERLGLAPMLVASCFSNFKVTWPDDLALARRLLA